MNLENFYIVATDPDEPALQVNISGPYLTQQAAQADLSAAIDEAAELDPSARAYRYRICKLPRSAPQLTPTRIGRAGRLKNTGSLPIP